MSQTVIGKTTYHDLNVNTLGQAKAYGKPDSVGDIAKSLEDVYHLFAVCKPCFGSLRSGMIASPASFRMVFTESKLWRR